MTSPADDEVKRRHVQGGGVDGVGLALFNDAQFVAFQGEDILIVGFGEYDLGWKLLGQRLPKNGISSDCLRISCTDFGVAIARASGNRCSSAPRPTK